MSPEPSQDQWRARHVATFPIRATMTPAVWLAVALLGQTTQEAAQEILDIDFACRRQPNCNTDRVDVATELLLSLSAADTVTEELVNAYKIAAHLTYTKFGPGSDLYLRTVAAHATALVTIGRPEQAVKLFASRAMGIQMQVEGAMDRAITHSIAGDEERVAATKARHREHKKEYVRAMRPVKRDVSATSVAAPADGPSLRTAPAGK